MTVSSQAKQVLGDHYQSFAEAQRPLISMQPSWILYGFDPFSEEVERMEEISGPGCELVKLKAVQLCFIVTIDQRNDHV
jgi:hypothetical protein